MTPILEDMHHTPIKWVKQAEAAKKYL